MLWNQKKNYFIFKRGQSYWFHKSSLKNKWISAEHLLWDSVISPTPERSEMCMQEGTRRLGRAPRRTGTWVKFCKQAAITKMKNGRKDSAGRMRSECKSHYWGLIMMHFHLNPRTFSEVSWASLIGSPAYVLLRLDSPSQAMALCVTLPPHQKAWANLNSFLFCI